MRQWFPALIGLVAILAVPVPTVAFGAPRAQGDGQADLQIAKTGPASVTVGDTFTYTITVTNPDADAATHVQVSDTLPAGVTLATVTTTLGTCTISNDTVTCNLGTLAAGAIATITVQVTADAAGDVTNTATVSSDNDPDATNNSSSVQTSVNPAPAPEGFVGPIAFIGEVQAITGGAWTIQGLTVLVTEDTQVRGSPQVGSIVLVRGTIDSEGTVTARRIGARVGRIEFSGVIESLPTGGLVGTWVIEGLTVEVAEDTEVKGTPEVGALAKVEGTLANGVVQAREIKVKEMDLSFNGLRRHRHGEIHRHPKFAGGEDKDDEGDEDSSHPGKDKGPGKGQGKGHGPDFLNGEDEEPDEDEEEDEEED